MEPKNHAEFEGYMPFVPKVRVLTTSKVCSFALKSDISINGEKRSTGCNCVAWGPAADLVGQARTSDLCNVKGYLSKQKIYPEVLSKNGKPIYETVIHVEEFSINGKTVRHAENPDGTDASLPFDL